MKIYIQLILCCLIFSGCSYNDSTNQAMTVQKKIIYEGARFAPLPKKLIGKIVVAKYSNTMIEDWEIASVDSLNIIQANYHDADSSSTVIYRVCCSYMPMAMGPGYENKVPPPLVKVDSVQLTYRNRNWEQK